MIHDRRCTHTPGCYLQRWTTGLMLAIFTAGAVHANALDNRGPVDADEFAARAIARVATLDLRAVTAPSQDDFQITADVFDIARTYAPNDREICRQWLEAAWSAGDRATALAATRRMIAIDPRDEVSTLRLIAARIGEFQTADERADAYARLLGPEGKALADTIRSRLALDAALLARERGDLDAFAAYLTQATTLDATHKEAAALAAAYVASNTDDPLARLEMLVNLLYADPVDPHVHEAIAHELAAQHAFVAARRFHTIAENLFVASLGELSNDLYLGRLYLLWQTDGAAALVDALDRRIELARLQEAGEIRRRGGVATAADLDRVTLSVPFELMRLMAASVSHDADSIASASRALGLVVESEIQRALAENPSEAQAAAIRIGLLMDLIIARLFCNVDIALAIEDVKTMERELPESLKTTPTIRLASGLVAIREGRLEDARAQIEPVAQYAAWGSMALALLELESRNTRAAITILDEVSQTSPLTLPGTWARSLLTTLDPSRVGPRPAAEAMERLVRSIPVSVDAMAQNPWSFISLTVSATNETPSALERAPLRVTLRNLADIPLGVGPNRPLATRLLFSPRASVGAEPLIGGSPEVVDVDTRFRLLPRESVSIDVSPELWWFGTLLETAVRHPTSLRWRVLQGFRIAPHGVYVQGPTSVTTESPKVRRAALPEASLPVEELARRMREDPESELLPIIAAVRATIAGPRVGTLVPSTPAEVAILADAAAQRYPKLSQRGRIIMVASMPHSRMIPAIRPLDDIMLEERDPDVARLVLITRPIDANHVIFHWARTSDVPALSRVARLQAERLESGRQCYARIRDLTGEHEGPLPDGRP